MTFQEQLASRSTVAGHLAADRPAGAGGDYGRRGIRPIGAGGGGKPRDQADAVTATILG